MRRMRRPGRAWTAYRGEILHSSGYRNPAPYAGQRVLVVGFGNSGGEIALDLAEARRRRDPGRARPGEDPAARPARPAAAELGDRAGLAAAARGRLHQCAGDPAGRRLDPRHWA